MFFCFCNDKAEQLLTHYISSGCHPGRDRMVVGFTTTFEISGYYHQSCGFEPRSGEVCSIQHYVIMFVSDWGQFFIRHSPLFIYLNQIGGVMASVLTSGAVDRGVKRRSGQTKDFNIGICCFSANNTPLGRQGKDWFARYQDNVSDVCCFSELIL